MNWPTKPLSARARAILIEGFFGRVISGTASNFLMNFGTSWVTGFFPRGISNLRNASSAEDGEEGGSPPPGEAMARPGKAERGHATTVNGDLLHG